jgi:hypothetical protein
LEVTHPVLELAISLLVIPVIWAFAEWRLGLLLCLATAILQDPLRKLTPDQPVLFVVFVGVVFGGMCVGVLASGIPLNPKIIFKRYPRLRGPFVLLLLLTVLEAFNSFMRFGNPMITLTGLLTYLLPLPSVVCAYQLVCRGGEFRVNQFMKWYIACVTLALTTLYLDFSGYHWSVLQSVGPQLLIYDRVTGLIITPRSGIFRSPEVAAWHAMTAACFVILMQFSQRINFGRFLTALMVAALLIALGMLTGRRKIVVEFAVFFSTYFILWVIFEKGAGKLLIIASTGAALIGYAWLAGQMREDAPMQYDPRASTYSRYVEHSENAFQQIPSRFVGLGMAPIMWAYHGYGLFGAGLGVGTQGTQYFGGGGTNAGAAEGGLGKITLELGIPGLIVMGWIAILVVRYFWEIMRIASRHSRGLARLSLGLFSFLVANVAAFSAATQVYGDLFILLILSWTVGFLLAVPVLVERQASARQLPALAELAPVFQAETV